jgi:hypothetical protein
VPSSRTRTVAPPLTLAGLHYGYATGREVSTFHAYPVDAQQDSISFTVAAHAGPVSVAYRQPSQGPRAQRVTRGCPPVATCTGTPGPLPCGCQERALDNRGSTGRIQADVRETYPRPQRGDRNNRTSSNPLTRTARTLNSWHSLAQLSSWCVNRISMQLLFSFCMYVDVVFVLCCWHVATVLRLAFHAGLACFRLVATVSIFF